MRIYNFRLLLIGRRTELYKGTEAVAALSMELVKVHRPRVRSASAALLHLLEAMNVDIVSLIGVEHHIQGIDSLRPALVALRGPLWSPGIAAALLARAVP